MFFILRWRDYVIDFTPENNGPGEAGRTECTISIVEGYEPLVRTTVAMGIARCSPQDQYNRELGRKISLGRAVKDLTGRAKLLKEERRVVWEAYFNRKSRLGDGPIVDLAP